jgi:broad specificity phosphatase PhoE
MSIFLVRHGETDGNAQRILQVPETPLNARGMRQADQLAARLAVRPITQILCSDFRRARMTAEPLAQRLGLPIETSALLQERNFGALRGKSYASLDCDPFAADFAPPGGETWNSFYVRVSAAFLLLGTRRAACTGDLLVVTHGFVCRALMERHFPCAPDFSVPQRPGNTSVSVFNDAPPHAPTLIDCCAHLGP